MRMLLVVLSLVVGCVEDRPEPAQVCVPGEVEECPCAGEQTSGAQTCNGDGTAFSVCACCQPHTTRSCSCQSAGKTGQQNCSAEGEWGSCYACQ